MWYPTYRWGWGCEALSPFLKKKRASKTKAGFLVQRHTPCICTGAEQNKSSAEECEESTASQISFSKATLRFSSRLRELEISAYRKLHMLHSTSSNACLVHVLNSLLGHEKPIPKKHRIIQKGKRGQYLASLAVRARGLAAWPRSQPRKATTASQRVANCINYVCACAQSAVSSFTNAAKNLFGKVSCTGGCWKCVTPRLCSDHLLDCMKTISFWPFWKARQFHHRIAQNCANSSNSTRNPTQRRLADKIK